MQLQKSDSPDVSGAKVTFRTGEDPLLTRLHRGNVGTGVRFLRQLAFFRQTLARGFDRLLALEELDLKLYDHQRQAVLTVLRNMRGRAVLADEVGLGKTIEAGLILKEYIVRRLAKSALILVPAPLTEQWRWELADKVALDCHVFRSGDDWREHERIIASLDTARRPEHARVLQKRAWDVVIVDEAHRLKNRHTYSWRLVDGLQKKYLLLLTATPIQNDLEELYNMMTLLQPGLLQTYNTFKRQYVQDKRSPKQIEKLRCQIEQVVVRTTRADSGLNWPRRIVRTVSVPFTRAERHFYTKVVAFARAVFAQGDEKTNVLPLILLLRELCSSPEAVYRTLTALAAPGRLNEVYRRQANSLAEEAGRLFGRSSKLQVAVDWLKNSSDPIIVFTQFRATQKALAGALAKGGIPVFLFHGEMDGDERQETLARFRRTGGVLISTEAGSEGQNLQFCRALINYDLPWNPMRVEQRIGRVHRLGQKSDVLIVNFVTPDTMEMHVFRLLHEKIKLFEQVIGDLDAILTSDGQDFLSEHDFGHRLGLIFLAGDEQGRMSKQLTAVEENLTKKKDRFKRIKQLNDQLLPTTKEAAPLNEGQQPKPTQFSAKDATASLLHPLCLDITFAEDVLLGRNTGDGKAIALERQLQRLQFVHGHARPLGRKLLHQSLLLFCFKVAYRSDETQERLHTLFVDPVTEKVFSTVLPEHPIDVRLSEAAASLPGVQKGPNEYVVRRLYDVARQEVTRLIAEEGQIYVGESLARFERDKERLDLFYEGLREEAFMPVVQQLRRLEAARTRIRWLQTVDPRRKADVAAGEAEGVELERVQRQLETIEGQLENERTRRLLELQQKYAVRAEVTLVAAASFIVPRVELRYQMVRPVRQEIRFFYDPLQDALLDLDCFHCGTLLQSIYLQDDGTTVCSRCWTASATGSD